MLALATGRQAADVASRVLSACAMVSLRPSESDQLWRVECQASRVRANATTIAPIPVPER